MAAKPPLSDLLSNDYVTREQFAHDILGKSTRTADRMEQLGIGPPRIRIGKLILYKKQSILEWVAAQEPRRQQPRRSRRAR